MEKNLDITKPRYSKNTLAFPWPFVISRFHCTCFFFITFLQVSKTIFSSTTIVLLIPLRVPTIMEAWCTTEKNFLLKMISPRLKFERLGYVATKATSFVLKNRCIDNFIFLQKTLSLQYLPSLHALKDWCDNSNVTWFSSGGANKWKKLPLQKIVVESDYSRQQKMKKFSSKRR